MATPVNLCESSEVFKIKISNARGVQRQDFPPFHISNFAFQIASFCQFLGDFDGFQDSRNLET